MSEIPTLTPEKKEALDDNARKFTLDGLTQTFLDDSNADSFVMTTDWLVTDEDSEEKLAYKKFKDGEVKILRIKKVMNDNGKRTSVKEEITKERYEELRAHSILQVKKIRFEFIYPQDGTDFSMKYDEFANSELRVLEVDAKDDDERESFDKTKFPTMLTEVTGNLDFYGYRVAGVVRNNS
jgi:hypothetical protein